MPTFDNPFLRFIEQETPEAFVFSRLPQQPSFGQQSFAREMVNPLIGRFRGEIARRALGGDISDMTFEDFLQQNFNFGRQYRRAAQGPGGSPIQRLF